MYYILLFLDMFPKIHNSHTDRKRDSLLFLLHAVKNKQTNKQVLFPVLAEMEQPHFPILLQLKIPGQKKKGKQMKMLKNGMKVDFRT